MKALFPRAAVLALVALAAGCATGPRGGGTPPVEVTRFHLSQPVARGTVAIEPFQAEDANRLEFRTYAAAVGQQLARLGWTVVPSPGQSEQVALIDVRQGHRQMLSRSPVSIGIGGGTGGWGGGVGGGITVPIGARGGDMIGTMLQVGLKRRSEGTVFWEGRAMTEARAGTPGSQPGVAVQRLATALFQDFPGESGRTIAVR